jgi:hypothetical protein
MRRVIMGIGILFKVMDPVSLGICIAAMLVGVGFMFQFLLDPPDNSGRILRLPCLTVVPTAIIGSWIPPYPGQEMFYAVMGAIAGYIAWGIYRQLFKLPETSNVVTD